MRQFAGLLNWN